MRDRRVAVRAKHVADGIRTLILGLEILTRRVKLPKGVLKSR